jgi:HSP20 family protein
MTAQKRSSGKKAGPEAGEPVVDIGLGSLFKGLSGFVDVLGKLAEASGQQTNRTGEFKVKGLGDNAHGVYGVSVRVGIGGARAADRRVRRGQ